MPTRLTRRSSPEAPAPPAHGAATGLLRRNHARDTSWLQRGVDQVTAVVGWPGFSPLLILAVGIWIGGNLLALRVARGAWDPPPFPGLQAVIGGAALLVSALVLTTQRREAELLGHRQQLILELSILNDQRVAKIIELIEEARRDNPLIPSRPDHAAAAMSEPSDPHQVLDAIKSADPDPDPDPDAAPAAAASPKEA